MLSACSPAGSESSWTIAETDQSDSLADSPERHAELCPNATAGVGLPMPVGGARVDSIHPFVEYVKAPAAQGRHFGVPNAEAVELVENQPDPPTFTFPTGITGTDEIEADRKSPWPEWLTYRFNSFSRTHEVIVRAAPLRAGTYHVSMPLLLRGRRAAGFFTSRLKLELIIRVRGLGFTSERLVAPHYVGDPPGPPLVLTLAGRRSSWRITDVPSWLRVSQREGRELKSVELTFTADEALEALGVGNHEGRLCVENGRGDAASIPVYALVERARLRPLYKQRYLYSFTSAEQLYSFNYILTDLREQVAWRATSSADWLKLPHTDGRTNERFDFSVDPATLSDGHHTAIVKVEDPSGHHDGAEFFIHYLKERRPSHWRLSGDVRHDAVSSISPHVIHLGSDRMIVRNVFTGQDAPVPARPRIASGAVVSEHGPRLHALTYDPDSRSGALRRYSWPDLVELGIRSTDCALEAPWESDTIKVGNHEYWASASRVLNLDDGRCGPVIASAGANRRRLRVYDDGSFVFAFWEDLGEPRPVGRTHWARGPDALCTFRKSGLEWTFICADAAGDYLTARPSPQPSLPFVNFNPFFTHQGGVYFEDHNSADLAFSAAGEPIAVEDPAPPLQAAKQWGDTLVIGEMGGRALGHLFE